VFQPVLNAADQLINGRCLIAAGLKRRADPEFGGMDEGLSVGDVGVCKVFVGGRLPGHERCSQNKYYTSSFGSLSLRGIFIFHFRQPAIAGGRGLNNKKSATESIEIKAVKGLSLSFLFALCNLCGSTFEDFGF